MQPNGTIRTYPPSNEVKEGEDDTFRQVRVAGIHLINKWERIVVYEDGVIDQSDGLINSKPKFEIRKTFLTSVGNNHMLVLQGFQNEVMGLVRTPTGSWSVQFLTDSPFPYKFKGLYGKMALGLSRANEMKVFEFGGLHNSDIVTECEISPSKSQASVGFIFDQDI